MYNCSYVQHRIISVASEIQKHMGKQLLHLRQQSHTEVHRVSWRKCVCLEHSVTPSLDEWNYFRTSPAYTILLSISPLKKSRNRTAYTGEARDSKTICILTADVSC